MAPLEPFNPPLGPQPANAALYSPHPITLAMKEKVFSVSGDDFVVKTTEGHEILRCKGKMMSMHDSKKFTDMAGNEIYTLKDKTLAIMKSFHADAPHGHGFQVKGHFKMMGSSSSVEFKNASDGQHIELDVKGDWIDKSASITWGGKPVAHISRSFLNVRQMFGDKQTVCLRPMSLVTIAS